MITPPAKTKASCQERLIEIPAGRRTVEGSLMVPTARRGIVVFAHGSGSGRFSPRNQFVAQAMRDVGMGTLLVDLLEEDEAQDRRNVFNIELLADRLEAAADWLRHNPDTHDLCRGYFGASTGAGAALVAAARQPGEIGAIVSRGGRPDLAGRSLGKVTAPTLLLVGGRDDGVIELNRQSLAALPCSKEMVIIPGATHLFPEPGALEEVARLAQNWFLRFLTLGAHSRQPH